MPRLGAEHHNARLTDDDVRVMRDIRRATGVGYRCLSLMFHCGESTVRDILKYRTRVPGRGPAARACALVTDWGLRPRLFDGEAST